MACDNCMDHKMYGRVRFTCPECGQEWGLVGVNPGAYWERGQETGRNNKAVESDGANPCASKDFCEDYKIAGPEMCDGCSSPRSSL